jgi:hypothetical protein
MSQANTDDDWELSYEELLDANYVIRKQSDVTYWLCTTRTTQESKLFPVPPYMLVSYIDAYYKWPDLLRKIKDEVSPEYLGDRAREVSTKLTTINSNWCLPTFYLLGRQTLMELGLLEHDDNIEDVQEVCEFSKRFNLAHRREQATMLNKEMEDMSQYLPERTLQVFEADMYDVEAGDDLLDAASKFMSTATQYAFLTHCECRIGLNNHGPYRLGDSDQMLVRQWFDLAEGDFPWMDDVAEGVPYNNLIMPVKMEDTDFNVVDDWGTFEATPSWESSNIDGIGLYTSDYLCDRHEPVGMDSREKLTETLEEITDELKQARDELWLRIADWNRDQMLEAGALVYSSAIKDMAHIAGVYDQDEWFTLDERAQALQPIFNDEFARDFGSAMWTNNSWQQLENEYYMSRYEPQEKHNGSMISLIPASVLNDHDYTRRANPEGLQLGDSKLPDKTGKFTTTQGKLSLTELNEAAKSHEPWYQQEPWKHYDDRWVKYNYTTDEADELYERTQKSSRFLEGAGASLTREDVLDRREN